MAPSFRNLDSFGSPGAFFQVFRRLTPWEKLFPNFQFCCVVIVTPKLIREIPSIMS
jgi:hypothetical protein